MQRKKLRFGKGFRVQITSQLSQAAEMVIEPGKSEGDSENRHKGAEQWLFVVDGTGTAIINGKKYPLSAGSLVLIEKGDIHEIRNTGDALLRTLNIYSPPAYKKDGNPLPRGKG